jgi:hypothetical protein
MKTFKALFFLGIILAIYSCKKDNLPPSGIPNGDFENWNSYNQLEDWKTTYNPFSMSQINSYVVQKTTDAYHGKYAVQLIYSGALIAEANTKFAVSSHPSNLTAFVKCKLNFRDTVSLKARVFYRGAIVDSGQWLGATPITAYQQINIPISKHSAQADSVMVSLRGGHVFLLTDNFQGGSSITTLWVDYLSLH